MEYWENSYQEIFRIADFKFDVDFDNTKLGIGGFSE